MNEDTPNIIDAEFTEVINDKVDAIIDKVLAEETQAPATFDAPGEEPIPDGQTAEPVKEVKIPRKERRAQEAWDRRIRSRTLKANKQFMIRTQREETAARVKRDAEASHARAIARKEVKIEVKPTE